MIDFNIKMEEELDDFYAERKRHNNFKLLIDFEQSSIEYTHKEMKMDDVKPKMKKKLRAAKFVPKNNNNKSLF
jgi:hypothetical protein